MTPTNTRRDFLKQTAAVTALGFASRAAGEPTSALCHFICVTCGMQYAAAPRPPAHCPICEDERQYVGHAGQQWTTLGGYRKTHKNVFAEPEPNLHTILPEPKAGIGQRAFLVRTNEGNVLWDCVPPLDDATIQRVKALGGIKAIAVSHPHYYTTMVEWSEAFGNVPIHLHKLDAQWVMRPDDRIKFGAARRNRSSAG
jgi:glyoxylase-like metal-dependent hydrolase (beta-lactamase superfamily II)